MRPFVLVVAPNPFEDSRTPAYESDFWLRTRSDHLASFSNLVRLFNPVGRSQGPLENPMKAIRPLAGYYLESFLKTRGYDARAVFTLDDSASWAAGAPATPTAVAVSTTFITSSDELSRTLVRVRSAVGSGVPIVVGGAFVWKQYLWGAERFAAREGYEAVPELVPLFGTHGDPALRDAVYVANEFGEHTLLRLLEAFRGGARTAADLASVQNLVLWTAAGWRATPRAAEPVDLDRDFTRWDIVDELPAAMVPVRTSAGCPHRCEFCDFVAVHPRLRLRSTSSIVEELRLVAGRGGTSVNFVDDNTLSSPARARALASALCESEMGIRWAGYLRADSVSEDDAPLLAKSGLMYGWCGIESGDLEMLRRMNKRSSPQALRAGIDALTAAGVHVAASFVLGFPGESRETIDATAAFFNGLRQDARGQLEYLIWPFYLVPGAPVDGAERRREFGLTGLFGGWRHATMSAEDVHATWAPYLFRAIDASYTYYGGDNSSLWSGSRRRQAVTQRKALTVAFLDGAPGEVVQERFAALYRTLRFTAGVEPDWRDHLAPRERQPGGGPRSQVDRPSRGGHT